MQIYAFQNVVAFMQYLPHDKVGTYVFMLANQKILKVDGVNTEKL